MNPVRFLRDLVVILIIVGTSVWGVTHWLLTPFVVEGPSMQPTLLDGERVLVDLWTLRKGIPHPGDVVVAIGPSGEEMVKRVAPDPHSGTDTYPSAALAPESPLEPSFVVLGDNPGNSLDSRSFGRIPRHRIRGRVLWRYWPPARLGPIE